MKKALRVVLSGMICAALGVLVGCEGGWTSGGGTQDLNTSLGAGVNINFSGVYKGRNGGKAVAQTSNGNITSFVISQGGNTIEVVDNQGSRYTGTVGSPGAVSTPSGGVYPAGAELAQAQVSWSGHDNVAAKNIQFVGVIHAVAIEDVSSTTEVIENSSENSSEDVQNRETTVSREETVTVEPGPGSSATTSIVETITETVGVPGDPFYSEKITTVETTFGPDGTVESQETSVTTTGNASNTSTDTQTGSSGSTETVERTYSISEANTQYRLEGTWMEEGGVVSSVDALSSGTAGVITTTTTEDAGTTPTP